ncbi:MAG: condensation domain-containing protein, partial [Bacteroidetes bacterium]|nr:condensation domain-containing protein [Bacteroidota bacterium]
RIQYRDYAAWQNELLKGPESEEHRQYWQEQFSGEIPVLQLPADFIRPQHLSPFGRRISDVIKGEHFSRLAGFAASMNCSRYSVFMALAAVLLYSHTKQEDIIIGYPLSLRDNTELENQIGCYLNTIPLRIKVNPSDDFISLVKSVHQRMSEAYSHRIYPYDKIVSDLPVSRNGGVGSLFNVVVVMQSLEIHRKATHKTGKIRVRELPANLVTSAVDFRIEFIERADHYDVNFECNTSLFRPATIDFFRKEFMILVERALQEDSGGVKTWRLLPEKVLASTADPAKPEEHFRIIF